MANAKHNEVHADGTVCEPGCQICAMRFPMSAGVRENGLRRKSLNGCLCIPQDKTESESKMAPRYIIKVLDGTPEILEQVEEGVYQQIGYGAGRQTTAALVSLIEAANTANQYRKI